MDQAATNKKISELKKKILLSGEIIHFIFIIEYTYLL